MKQCARLSLSLSLSKGFPLSPASNHNNDSNNSNNDNVNNIESVNQRMDEGGDLCLLFLG